MDIRINDDETIEMLDGEGLAGIAVDGNISLVNQLDKDEILAVLASAAARPFEPEAIMSRMFAHTLRLVRTSPNEVFEGGKPNATLGQLRKAVVKKIGGQFNDPLSQYLDVATKAKAA